MEIEINNRKLKVKVVQLKDKEGNLRFNKNNEPVNKYYLDAFSNPNKLNSSYEDWLFYENVMKTDKDLYNTKRNDIVNQLFYYITGFSSWDLSGANSDMWGVMEVRNYENGNVIRVEFDQYDHGLLVAFLMIRELHPEDF